MLSLEQVRAMLESAADQIEPALPLNPTVTCKVFMLKGFLDRPDVGDDDIALKVVAMWTGGRGAEVKGIVTGEERKSPKVIANYIATMIHELTLGAHRVASTF